MPKPSERPQALKVSDFKKYLTIPLLLWYYKEINKAGSLESDVDAFYLNFLKEVFTLKDNFGIEQESRPAKDLGLSQRADFTIRFIKNGDGNIDGVPQSERLVVDTPVTRLRVTFDGFKLTALAVGVSLCSQSNTTHPAKIDLRHAALWYPRIPPDTIFLNEDSFTDQGPMSRGYRPLSWIRFGGTSGKSIGHIQGILVQSSHGLHGLQFVYDKMHGTRYSDKLGRCRESALPCKPLFFIDGAGGERIDSVCVGLSRYEEGDDRGFLQHGVLESVIITTNRDRTLHIGKQINDGELRPISIAAGTTITGFYGHFDAMYGLISLGVMSERIAEELCE